jgi:hypothetical protein
VVSPQHQVGFYVAQASSFLHNGRPFFNGNPVGNAAAVVSVAAPFSAPSAMFEFAVQVMVWSVGLTVAGLAP